MAAIIGYGKEWNEVGEAPLEIVETCGLNRGEIAFTDEEGGLEIVVPVDENGSTTVVEVAEGVLGVVGAAREAKPENIDGNTPLDDVEVSSGDGCCVAAIAANGERSMNLNGTVGRFDLNADDLCAGVEEAGNFVLHEEMECGELGGFGGEEVEEVPLRHERDEFGCGGEVGEIREWV